ncbi:MAG TPA: copper homeostasis membrane protein CopD [Candidatus Baltobacteraceae bacterium]|nr:copper homeostasis membrane protein CopD [Candidatus Baltobacteraceae bacterium]
MRYRSIRTQPKATSRSRSRGAKPIDPLLSATRLLHYAASVLLEGTFVFWCLIAWPAFHRTNAARMLQARLDRRLFALSWVSLLIALASGAGWLLIVASNMSGTPLNSIFQGGVVGIVLSQTRFGVDWVIRAGLIVVLAGCLVVQARTRKHAAGWVGLLAASAFIASLAWAGHGAATEDVPFDAIHAPADVLHLLAAGAWLGALLPLAILLAQAWRDKSPQAVAVARTVTLRFSVLGLLSVGTLIVTGIVNTWFLAGTVPALLGTLYGQLLLVKIALFATMIALASVNQRRLLPCLADSASEDTLCMQVCRQVYRNASIEAGLGVFVLGIVGVIGILPPGLHTEPHWPLPFRFDLSELSAGAHAVFNVAAIAFALCLTATIVVAERRRYRAVAVSIALLILFGGVSWVALRPGIVQAYPTSFYASTQPYAAPSIARGAPLYSQNCAVCHGATGRGNGPLAGKLPIHPADLTEPHLFAHKVGEMFWWVSYGRDNGVMPGFADKLTPGQRWDLINFILARAAGDLTQHTASQISTATALPLPDFAFEQNGAQNTLSQTLKNGPVLVVLFATHAPRARLEQLARWQPRLAAAGLHVLAVGLSPSTDSGPSIVDVSEDVRIALALFRSPLDGDETELMLDRGANVRARWTATGVGGLANSRILLSDAARVASIPVAAANHAGHAQ